MKRETMNIKDHICPSCGGALRVDVARQMYECPFCGVTFDYDYFREENVLELADRALIAGEIYSAKQAYEFMLTKEPDNFVALRGMSLIDMKMAGVEKLKDVDNYRKVSYLAASNSLDKVIEVCKPENKDYFVLMKDMLSAGHEYFSEDKLIQKEREERSKLSDKLNETIKKRDEICKGKNGNPIDSNGIIALCTACLVYWCIMSIIIFAVAHAKNILILAVVIGIPVAIVSLITLCLKLRDKKYNDSINEIKKTIEGHSAEIRRHEDNKTELKDRITAAYKDLRSFDPVI